ncbi:ferredoxin--NADP reductase [Idiomarina xiamenensis]|uniref:ferredoxin--NADP(+) reductase n=1 Tax=Idiomarina xiamenensis 10-D-4 TaxID=740709 RepID=K2L0L4_9GAMM|nr:ferredoxin--NADP reductase [Idiomarina xiamenensis]EKE83455.1 ferredoxin-NADP reductase [Idiomarina xiamenensis 10-D-4]
MADWLTGQVVENYQWHPDLFSLRVMAPRFEFTAGQFVRLGLTLDEQRVQRAYSLCNAPDDAVLDFLVTRVPQGKLSTALAELKAGDSVALSQPATGFFTLQEVPDGDSLWLLATGTGIGPYLSMLATSEPWQRYKRIVLVHAVRFAADLAYQSLINSWREKYPQQFHYQPIVSRENVPGVLRGRIPQLIKSGDLQRACQTDLNPRSQVMICGNPDMIRETRKLLDELGLPKNLRRKPGNVTVEQYW